MMNVNYQVKRKAISDKEIIDFFALIEDKFENNTKNIQYISDAFNKYNNSNEEEVLLKMKTILSEYPILILELNKLLPKSSRLQLVDRENADSFLLKIKNKDEFTFKECMKALLSLKNGEINPEKLVSRFEELLMKYPELLEEAYIYIDPKKLNSPNYRKIVYGKMSQSRADMKKSSVDLKHSYIMSKIKDIGSTPVKNQSNPEYLFFESLKNVFDSNQFKTLIKLLYLYNEGVLNYAEYIELNESYFSNNSDLFEYLKQITYSKIMNRRHYSLINKPLSELDLSKSQRICTSYTELPESYPNLICSGRTNEMIGMLNDRYISIPAGSEDDKNPMKKNHYQENIFKFEDQRYENDMIIEILKFAMEGLNNLNEKANASNQLINLNKDLGPSVIRFISRFYKEYGNQVLQGIEYHPKDTIPIVINRFKKRLDDALNQKAELEKSIKLTFDKIYSKSFDYKSFKFKNYEKKNNNAKAFMKEINSRKKEKLSTNNINIIKGGIDNFEFYTTMNIKNLREYVQKTKQLDKQFKNKDLTELSIKKKLPEMRMIFDNLEILKISICLIFYTIYYSQDSNKIADFLSLFFDQFFKINVKDLIKTLFNNNIENEKNYNYNDILVDSIKNKSPSSEIDKIYTFDKFSQVIKINNDESSEFTSLFENQKISSSNNDNNSEISLTPSLQSQDSGRTYKETVIREESSNETINTLFYPSKMKNDSLLYGNENIFVLVRYIFCIYERLNKLYEFSLSQDNSYTNGNTHNVVFKNFIVIYKALIHKKIENASFYEDLCKDILGNESYFLFNMDKLVNSLIKSLSSICNDNITRECVNLYLYEKNRKKSLNENLYFSNFIQLTEIYNISSFRILYSPEDRIMSIHVIENQIEQNRKEYLENYKEFLESLMQESYSKLIKENISQDEPFTIYLRRNVEMIKKRKKLNKIVKNNLQFKFDYVTKKLYFISSGSDYLEIRKEPKSNIEKLKVILKKNIKYRKWNESQIILIK